MESLPLRPATSFEVNLGIANKKVKATDDKITSREAARADQDQLHLRAPP